MQSRYYDAEIGRFISVNTTDVLYNSDVLLQNNLFAYCINNPIMYIDPTGEFALTLSFAIKLVFTVFVIGLTVYITSTPEFKRAVANLMDLLLDGLTSAYENVKREIKTKTDSLAKALEKAVIKARTRIKSGKTQRHHIVAKGKVLCRPAKNVLESVGINADTYSTKSPNIVVISYELHKHIHNDAYYSITNSLVIIAYSHGRNNRDRAKRVEKI